MVDGHIAQGDLVMSKIVANFSVEDVKKAFWKTFYREGEIFFDYMGTDAECEYSVNDYWVDFLENLKETK